MAAHLAVVEGQRDAKRAEAEAEALAAARVDHEAELDRCGQGVEGCIHWIESWVWTYDPRLVTRAGSEGGFVRLRLWPKQRDAVRWLFWLIESGEEGVWEKARDGGASYLCVAVSLWFWRFRPGFKATFGSRVKEEVDVRDVPDTLFEKARIILRRLPLWMLPDGFSWTTHDNYMRITNPANGASIRGQGGKNMGRGGRSTFYLVDEAAFIENGHAVERAVTGNADAVAWVSTANAIGDLVYQKLAKLPAACRFRSHWSDDPRKDEAWAAKKRASYVDPTGFAREYDLDWTASLDAVCIPAAWVVAAQELARLEPLVKRSGVGVTGGDIGGGKALSVAVHRFGPVVLPPDIRQEADTTETAYWLLDACLAAGTRLLNFDAPGIGAGVLSTLTKAEADRRYESIKRQPVNTGDAVTDRVWVEARDDQDEVTSADILANLKAELWWLMRRRFQLTWEHVRAIRGEEGGRRHPVADLISLPADATLAMQLSIPRFFRNGSGKIILESKAQLAHRNVPSPDYADALVLTALEPEDDPLAGLDVGAGLMQRANPWAVGSNRPGED